VAATNCRRDSFLRDIAFPPDLLLYFLDFVLTDSTGVNHLYPHVGAKILTEKIRAELKAGVEKSGR